MRAVRSRRVFAAIARCVLAGIVIHILAETDVDQVAIRAFLELSWVLGADHLLHTVVSVLAVCGWLRHRPRGLLPDGRRANGGGPLTWFGLTVVRGWLVAGYPHGIPAVTTLSAVGIARPVFAVAASAPALVARLDRTGRETQ